MAGAKEEDGGNAQEDSELGKATELVIIPAQELIETMQILLFCSDVSYVKRVRALRIKTFPAID